MQGKTQRLRNPELPRTVMMMVAFSERREGTREWRAEFPVEREPEHCPTHFPAPYYSGIFISKTALRPKVACAISRIHCARKWCKQGGYWKTCSWKT